MSERADPGWRVVAGREVRDLWVGGRGPLLVLAFSVLLSAITYLAATNQVLDYLAQRDAVDLVLRVVVAVGVLVTLVVSADAISGERERGTLESLLLAPISRRQVVIGKLLAALTLWFAAFGVGVLYVWVIGRSAPIVGAAALLGLVLGTLLVFTLAVMGLLISAAAGSNRVSLSVSLFVLLALFALTQLPSSPNQSWVADLLVRINPVGSGLHYVSGLLVRGNGWTAELSYVVSPGLAAVIAGVALSVDPEDWSGDPIVDVPQLAPGASTSLSWELKAGDIGSFALYVVLLPAEPRAATERDQLSALRLGADDYLPKPFSYRILVARLHALLRRAGPRRETILTTTRTGSTRARRSSSTTCSAIPRSRGC